MMGFAAISGWPNRRPVREAAMSANRTARNEAWITSLVLHAGLLAGVVAVVGRPREPVVGPVAVNTRASGHEIGVVMLDRPAVLPPPAALPPVPAKPLTVPVVPVAAPPQPSAPSAPATAVAPPAPVQMVGHRVEIPPVAQAPGSPQAPPNPAVSEPPLLVGTATEFFGVPAVGKSVVFVLDRSASMGLDGRLDRARRELAASLRRLPPSARFQVIAYNRVAEPLRLPGMYGLLPATPDAIEAAVATLNRLTAEGSTDHRKAVQDALALGPDVVYFLTDEDDLEARDVQAVTRLNRGRVSIHALCLVPPAGGETPMAGLARNNRGLFTVVR
jgi:hypothetical protein